MPFNRRDFLKLAGVTGLTVASPFPFLGKAFGEEDAYTGPLFLFVNAGGGWDPTSLCDPKGRANEEEEKPVNYYFKDEIDSVGDIKFAPVEGHKEFFERHKSRTMVINGIDTATNGHDSGSRHIWSGNLAEGHPSLGALIASVHAPGKAMAYITNGGYDATFNVVSRTRVGDIGAIARIAYPNEVDPSNRDNNERYHTENTMARIEAAQRARLEAMGEHSHLPHDHQAISTLHLARNSNNELKKLTEYLPEIDGSQLRRQAQVAIAAYRAGLCVSANLAVGGFDTHGNHDDNHYPRMANLLSGITDIWNEAETAGIADNLVVMVGSDFGRTPYYNANNGKDHWSVTSMLLMGKGIPAGKVVGGTTDRYSLKTVNPETLAVLDNQEEGIRLTPAHIHNELRKLSGISDVQHVQRFPLRVEDIPLFK